MLEAVVEDDVSNPWTSKRPVAFGLWRRASKSDFVLWNEVSRLSTLTTKSVFVFLDT